MLDALVPEIPLAFGAAVLELSEDVVVDELPSLIPLSVVLPVRVAVRPAAFVQVEFVDELRPETKLTKAHLKLPSVLHFKKIQISNLVE